MLHEGLSDSITFVFWWWGGMMHSVLLQAPDIIKCSCLVHVDAHIRTCRLLRV